MNEILLSICLLGCLTYLFTSFYRYKFSYATTVLFFIVSCILLTFVNSKDIQVSAILIILIAYIFLLYEGKFSKMIEHFALYCVFVPLAYIAGSKIIEIYVSHPISFYNKEFPYLTVIISILLIYMIFSYTKMENLFKLVNLPNYSRYLLILPIGSVFLIPFIAKTQGSSILTTVLITGILLFTLCIELIYIASIQALNKDHEKTLQRYMETSSQNKYDLLNQQYQNSFNLLHEIMHKCNELIIQMRNKNYEKVESELNDITNATFKEFNEIYSNSVVFNTLLSNRKSLLQKHNIHVNSTIEFNNFEFISFSNQVDLFNTLLDFVLEEAKKSNTNKHVFIKSNMVAQQVILSFRFANNHNRNLQREISAALEKILKNYEAILSVNEIDENTASLLILFPKQN